MPEYSHNTRNRDLYKQIEEYNQRVANNNATVNDSEQESQNAEDDYKERANRVSKIFFVSLVTIQSVGIVFFTTLYFAYNSKASWAYSTVAWLTDILHY